MILSSTDHTKPAASSGVKLTRTALSRKDTYNTLRMASSVSIVQTNKSPPPPLYHALPHASASSLPPLFSGASDSRKPSLPVRSNLWCLTSPTFASIKFSTELRGASCNLLSMLICGATCCILKGSGRQEKGED